MRTTYAFAGCIAGLLGVALGAFGAHALAPMLASRGMTEVWHTAVLYQFVHALALLWAGSGGALPRSRATAGKFWGAGIVLFSGSLYALALTGWRPLGIVTPFGGVAFLIGWSAAAVSCLRADRAS